MRTLFHQLQGIASYPGHSHLQSLQYVNTEGEGRGDLVRIKVDTGGTVPNHNNSHFATLSMWSPHCVDGPAF